MHINIYIYTHKYISVSHVYKRNVNVSNNLHGFHKETKYILSVVAFSWILYFICMYKHFSLKMIE